MTDVFSRFPPFLQEYIYSSGWETLKEVQLKAADVLFNTDKNLLITSETASGKTEAALFPMISDLYENPPSSFGVLYIAPLKSLINDQFSRLDFVLDQSGIPVFHWHGDVSSSHKAKALKNPSGILQITPESLESMLMNRSNDIVRIFSDLRYVVIDEIHTLTGSDRGNQIICQLCRIASLIGRHPVRVGLSATIGDVDIAGNWLGAGTGRETVVVGQSEKKTSWRLGMEHFFIQNDEESLGKGKSATAVSDQNTSIDKGYEFVYDVTKGKKCIVFSNSREETEYITATLRQIASRRGERDVFSIHHGNLSAIIREEAEERLKADDDDSITCATVTLELGIDVGRLERIVQIDSPLSVSSFLQRMGRSGRRGTPPEMVMVFREEEPLPNTPLPELIPWGLIRAIAIVQLYIEERFIEPPKVKKLPFSLLFQQTLSILSSSGEITLKDLAKKVLSLPPFENVSKEDYKELVVSMIKGDYIQITEQKGLVLGLKGEKLTSSFKFYASFRDSEDYTVRDGSGEIGTITTPPPVGDRFALAGRVWEVDELDNQRRLIFVHPVEGKMEISWPGDYGEVHTKILERMKRVLTEDTVYPYLKPNAVKRLNEARNLVEKTGLDKKSIVKLGQFTYCFFPWLGTKSFRAMRKLVMKAGASLGVKAMEHDGCYYMTFRMEKGDETELLSVLEKEVENGLEPTSLVGNNEAPVFEKYDDFIPGDLLRRAYAVDRLSTEEAVKRLEEILNEL